MKKTNRRLRAAIAETARDLRDAGLMPESEARKITMRMIEKNALPVVTPLSGKKIKEMRERAGLSQAVCLRVISTSRSAM